MTSLSNAASKAVDAQDTRWGAAWTTPPVRHATDAYRPIGPAIVLWSVSQTSVREDNGAPSTAPADCPSPVPAGSSRTSGDARRRSSGLNRRALDRAFAFIEHNITESFSLDDLAGAAGVSRFHFSRMFRLSTGESPMAFALKLRIERAKEMLARGDRSVCDVAMDLSFFDQSHFSRTFRRLTGVSPSRFTRESERAA